MSDVSNLLDSKGRDVLTVKPDQTIKDALVLMGRIAAGTCVVMDDGKVVGIVSERDIIKKVVMKDRSAAEVTIADIMTTDLEMISPKTSLEECMQIMTDKRIRHLPVLRDEQLFGIVSIGDVVKYLIIEKDFKIRNLETYIKGVE